VGQWDDSDMLINRVPVRRRPRSRSMVALALVALAYTPALVLRSAASQHVPAARRCAAPRGQQRSISISTEKLQLGDGQVANRHTSTPRALPPPRRDQHHHYHHHRAHPPTT